MFSVDIKEQAVSDLFAICGDVENVRIIRDAATGIGKGFGYVLFKVTTSIENINSKIHKHITAIISGSLKQYIGNTLMF